MIFLAYLVARYKFANATATFLMVGHTHENIGYRLNKITLSTLAGIWNQCV
jgi:hypothetical protein